MKIVYPLLAIALLLFVNCAPAEQAEPPIISDIAISNVTDRSALITWTVDACQATWIEYGTERSFDKKAEPASNEAPYNVYVQDLDEARNYYFRIVAEGASKVRTVSDDHAFRTTSEVLVGAYYYPWWTSRKWAEQAQGYLHTPDLGRYWSGNTAVIDQHIAWSAYCEIDFLAVSWWGPHWEYSRDDCSYRDRVLGRLMDRVEARQPLDLSTCILYETSGRLKDAGGFHPSTITNDGRSNEQVLKDDLAYFSQNYFGRPSYLKLDGRPVIFVYMADGFIGWDNALAGIREDLALKGCDPFIIGMHDFWLGPDWHKLCLFDAATSYNLYTTDASRLPIVDNEIQKDGYLSAAAERFDVWSAMANAMIPLVMPGYDDSIWRHPVKLTRTPEFFQDHWELAIRYLRPGSDCNMIMITSFNEWHEGTQIEPAGEYGASYLEVVKQMSRSAR